ncbi:hypothetical protein HYY69_05050 [Candidatus Woesearchaeota archaeon]|nr:hypothetical protein [Candidatus Woesearchaeota archaeon]
MALTRKLKQKKWSTEAALAIMFFLLAIVLYLLFTLSSLSQKNVDTILKQDNLKEEDLSYLTSLNCDEIKAMLSTEKNICIYAKDPEGNLVPLTNDKLGVGCPGIIVDGVKVCG